MDISVSILCYNYGRFLGQAIDSVLGQMSSSRGEPDRGQPSVLVIDDGSTDETPEVCGRFAGCIRVLRSPNEGFGASLTKAIQHASGEYVCLLDADDYFAPGKLARLGYEIKSRGGPARVLYLDHAQYFVDQAGKQLPGVTHGGNTSTICVHRASALPLLPIENEVALQTILRAGAGVRLPEPLGYYRLHDASMTNRSAPGRQNDYLAGVHRRLADRLHHMTPVPGWLGSSRVADAIARDFRALSHYNELEAALERGARVQAVRACLDMLRTAFGSASGYTSLHARMLVKTLLMRPSFPKHG